MTVEQSNLDDLNRAAMNGIVFVSVEIFLAFYNFFAGIWQGFQTRSFLIVFFQNRPPASAWLGMVRSLTYSLEAESIIKSIR